MAVATGTIQVKYSSTTGHTPSGLLSGELAVNLTDGILWMGGQGTGGATIGKDTYVLYNNNGTILGNSTFIYNYTSNYLYVGGKLGVGNIPSAQLDVYSSGTATAISTINVYNNASTIYGLFSQAGGGTSNVNVYGVYGIVVSGPTGNTYGVYGQSQATGTASYGGRFNANGAATINYGTYNVATSGTTNIAGYFNTSTGASDLAIQAAGNVQVKGNTSTSSVISVWSVDNTAAHHLQDWCNSSGVAQSYIDGTGTLNANNITTNGSLYVTGLINQDTSYSATVALSVTFANGVTNQKADLYMTGTQSLGGCLDITLASGYSNSDASGTLWRRYYLCFNPGGGGNIYVNQVKTMDDGGNTSTNYALSPLTWDSTNSRYRIQVVSITSAGNPVYIRLRYVSGSGTGSVTNFLTYTIGSIYTTDATIWTSQHADWLIDNPATSTRNVIIPIADAVGLAVQQYSTNQTSHLQEWQNTSGSALAYVDLNGNICAGPATNGLIIGTTYGDASVVWRDSSTNTWAQYKNPSDAHLYIRDLVNSRYQVTLTPGTTSNAAVSAFGSQITSDALTVTGSVAAATQLTVQGAASQSSYLTVWQTSTPSMVAYISATGALGILGGYGSTYTSGSVMVIGGHGTSPNAGSICWGDGTGWNLNFGYSASGTFTSLITFTDSGAITATSFTGVGSGLTTLNASNLSSGTVGTARLGTGTASASTFLCGNQTWATPTFTAGATTQVIYNSSGTLTGNAGLTFAAGTGTLSATNLVANGNLTVTGTVIQNSQNEATVVVPPIVFANNVANQKADLYMVGLSAQFLFGIIDVYLTSDFNYADVAGVLWRRYYLGFDGHTGTSNIYTNVVRTMDDGGQTSSEFALSPLTWDSTNQRYRIQVICLTSINNGNTAYITLRHISGYTPTLGNFLTYTAGSVYTTDSTVWTQQQPVWLFNAPSNSTRNVIIPAADVVGLAIQQYSTGQTSHLQEWQNTSGTALAYIGPAGGLTLASAGNTVSTYTFRMSASSSVIDAGSMLLDQGSTYGWKVSPAGTGSATNGALSFKYVTVSTGVVTNNTAFTLGSGIGITAQINSAAITDKVLVVQGLISQAANLQEWQNSGGSALAYVDKSGIGNFPQIGIGTVPNYPLDVSTSTASKAVNVYNSNTSGGVCTGVWSNATAAATYVYAVYGIASGAAGSTTVNGGDFWAYGPATTSNGVYAYASGATTNNGINAAATGTATNNYGVQGNATGGTALNIAGNFIAGTNATQNYSIYGQGGAAILGNMDTTQLIIRGNTTSPYTQTNLLQAWQSYAAGSMAMVASVGPLGLPLDDTGLTTRKFIYSRGQNLFTNGSGLLGTNYNLDGSYGSNALTFDPVTTYGGLGSFKCTGNNITVYGTEIMPVDGSKYYRLSVWAMAGDTGGGNYNAANVQYFGLCPFDIDGYTISPQFYFLVQGAAQTTLAAQLLNGATTMTLTNAAGWYNGATYYSRNIIWWPYTNNEGYSYPNYTYSRNSSQNYGVYSVSAGMWAAGGISGNVVTLTAPWPGPTLPAGTPVANNSSGGNYKYVTMSVVTVPNAWTFYTGTIGGWDTTGSGSNNLFPYGTAYVRLLILPNNTMSGNNMRYSNIWFSELSSWNLEAATATNPGVVSTGSQTFAGSKTFNNTIYSVQIDNNANNPNSFGCAPVAGTILAVNTNQTGNVGIVVQGQSGQTAYLQQWQDYNGYVLAGVSNAGDFMLPRHNAGTANGDSWYISFNNASNTDWMSMGWTSSNYTTGGVLANWVGNNQGFLYVPGTFTIGTGTASTGAIASFNSTGVGILNGSLAVATTIATTNGWVNGNVSGGAGGTALYGVASNTGGLSYGLQAKAQGTNSSTNYGAYLYATGGAGNQGCNISVVGAGTTGTNYGIYAICGSGGATNYGAYITSGAAATTNYGIYTVVTGTGASAQTGAYISASGGSGGNTALSLNSSNYGLVIASGSNSGDYAINASGRVIIAATLASSNILTIQGAASQSGNLQQWQNNNPTVLTFVSQTGQFCVGSTTSNGSFSVLMNPSGAGNIPLRLQASSSGNIQNWETSGGSVLAYVDVSGNFNGSGSGLTTLNASNVSSGTLNPARVGPPGSDTQVLFNDGLTFAAAAGLIYSKATETTQAYNLTVSNTLTASLNASSLSSGTAPTARLGSGTASAAVFLRGDQTWSSPSVSRAFGAAGTPTVNGTTPPIFLDRAFVCNGLTIACGTAPSGGPVTIQIQTSTNGTTWSNLTNGAVSATSGNYSGTATCTTAISANTFIQAQFTAVNGAANITALLFLGG